MKKSYKLGLAAIAASISIVGCGGSGTVSTTVTKSFVDAPVAGLTYVCSSDLNGTTNTNGEFTCNIGDSVEFFIGKYSLGTLSEVTATALPVSPYTIYPDDVEAAIDVAQLLQTIDDPNDDGVITITENYSALDNVTVKPGDNGFDTDVDLTNALGSALEDPEVAQANIYSDATAELLAGKTVYTTLPDDDMIFGVKLTFNDDLTKVTWKNLMSGKSGTETITVNDGTITINIPNDPNKIISNVTLDANAATYYLATIDGTPCKLYFNETTFTQNTVTMMDVDVVYYAQLANTGNYGYKVTGNISGALNPQDNITYYFATDKFGESSFDGIQYDYIAYSEDGKLYDIGFFYNNTTSSVGLYSQVGKTNFTTYRITDNGVGNPEILETGEGDIGTFTVTDIKMFSLTVQP